MSAFLSVTTCQKLDTGISHAVATAIAVITETACSRVRYWIKQQMFNSHLFWMQSCTFGCSVSRIGSDHETMQAYSKSNNRCTAALVTSAHVRFWQTRIRIRSMFLFASCSQIRR